MSEIPYLFDLPPPRYFRENGWFSNPNMVIFIYWAFARCSLEKRTVYHIQKAIELEPFEFIFGRRICSEETGLSEREIRTCLEQLCDQQKSHTFISILKKTTSKTTNKFTVYKWSTELFSKVKNQQIDQQTTSRRPADDHNQEDKKTRSKEDHHPNPSSSKVVAIGEVIDGLTDDFSFEKSTENKQIALASSSYEMQHNVNYQPEAERVEVISGIFLSPTDLEACIKIKGDIEKVKEAINFIMSSKKRKHDISDWPNALAKWKIENKAKAKVDENITYADKLCKTFPDFKSGRGWRCYLFTDKKKDQRGVLFEPESAYKEAFFISFSDAEFQKKCYNHLMENKIITK